MRKIFTPIFVITIMLATPVAMADNDKKETSSKAKTECVSKEKSKDSKDSKACDKKASCAETTCCKEKSSEKKAADKNTDKKAGHEMKSCGKKQ